MKKMMREMQWRENPAQAAGKNEMSLEKEIRVPEERPYLKTGVLSLTGQRLPWLLVLMISGMVTGGILSSYENAFAAVPLLVSFVPMLTDTGGNAGSQSSTMVIRGMALGEILPGDAFRVLWKEMRVGLAAGLVLGMVNFIRLAVQYPGSQMLAFTVMLSLMAAVVMAKTIGSLLPLAAEALHMDPAIMAAPLITTIVDGVSLIVYFKLACGLMHL